MQTTERGNNRFSREGGVTLLEIIIAMLLMGFVAAGAMGAFVFGRRMSIRSATELDAAQLQSQIMENLRMAVGGDSPGGLRLEAGIYIDDFYDLDDVPAGAIYLPDNDPINPPVNPLNFPPAFRRFQLDSDDDSDNIPDGTLLTVENFDENDNGIGDEDFDGDGLIGLDFDGDGVTDLRRIRLRINWTSPTA